LANDAKMLKSMNRAAFCSLAGILWMAGAQCRAQATDADTFSPVISYQFQDSIFAPDSPIALTSPGVSYHFLDSLSETDGDTPISSPVVGYRYFDYPGDENLTFANSANVSYYFSGGVSLTASGTVRTGSGVPVAGAIIAFKRYGTVFWTGTSTASGTFAAVNVQAANFTVTVTKLGFTTLVESYGGTSGGNQVVDLWLSPAPAPPVVLATTQVPPSSALQSPPPIPGQEPKLLVYNGTNQFSESAPVFPDRPTVVLCHGWQPTFAGPPTQALDWALSLAYLIRNNHGLAQPPNIVVWDWRYVAHTNMPETQTAATQGLALGRALQASPLGASYGGRLHFIGHSLGTIVNCYACDYVHGNLPVRGTTNPNPAISWSSVITRPHITTMDEAELASVADQRVLASGEMAWQAKEMRDKLLGVVRTAAIGVATWKSPIPRTPVVWIDNYISAFGFHRNEAVNICLLTPSLTIGTQPQGDLTQQLADAHSYAHLWYRNSVASGVQPGFKSAFEAGSSLPPTGTGLSVGNDWYENLATSNAFDLTRNLSDVTPVGLPVANVDAPILLALLENTAVLPKVETAAQLGYDSTFGLLDATGRYVMSGYESGIEWAGGVGGTVIYKTGQVYSSVKEKIGHWWDASLDAAADVPNSIDPESQLAGEIVAPVFSITLQTQTAPQTAALGSAGRGTSVLAGQPAYAWVSLKVPANAALMAFDFTVTGDPKEDFVVCAVNGQNVFNLPAILAPDGSPVSTDMIDVSSYAGQTVDFLFGLAGGTSTDASVTVDGIRFITIPVPKVGITTHGPNIAVKWPAAAVGWTLEESDTLAPDSWQPVSLAGVTVAGGVATIEQAMAGPSKFYRLRRNSPTP
jgi:hypothetical protein